MFGIFSLVSLSLSKKIVSLMQRAFSYSWGSTWAPWDFNPHVAKSQLRACRSGQSQSHLKNHVIAYPCTNWWSYLTAGTENTCFNAALISGAQNSLVCGKQWLSAFHFNGQWSFWNFGNVTLSKRIYQSSKIVSPSFSISRILLDPLSPTIYLTLFVLIEQIVWSNCRQKSANDE